MLTQDLAENLKHFKTNGSERFSTISVLRQSSQKSELDVPALTMAAKYKVRSL
jgi:hypothetical protein